MHAWLDLSVSHRSIYLSVLIKITLCVPDGCDALIISTYRKTQLPFCLHPSRHLLLHCSLKHPVCPIKCLKLGINKVELSSMSVWLPWSVSTAGGSCGPDSHGAPHAGNPLDLTNCCTNKLPLTTEKHKGKHSDFLSVHKWNMTYY